MNIDIKSIITNSLLNIYESNFIIIAIVFIMALSAYIFRNDIEYYLNLTTRGRNKFAEKSLFAMAIIGVLTAFYLYVKEYYFLLLIIPSFILTYFLYQIGFFDIVIEKWEDRNGK